MIPRDETIEAYMATPEGVAALADFGRIEAAKAAMFSRTPTDDDLDAVGDWLPDEYDPAFAPTPTEIRARVNVGTSPDAATAARELATIHRYTEALRRRAHAIQTERDLAQQYQAHICDICGQYDRSTVQTYPAFWGDQYVGLRHRIRLELKRDVRAHNACLAALDFTDRQRAAAAKSGTKTLSAHAAAFLDDHPGIGL